MNSDEAADPLLATTFDLELEKTAVSSRPDRNRFAVAKYVHFACLVIGLVFGVVVGAVFSTSASRNSGIRPALASQRQTFVLDETFGSRPSPETNAAWKSLFPKQGGFFKHPDIAPERSAFSVFHTLHCVDGLRHGYYVLHDAHEEGKLLNVSNLPFHASTEHAKHCFDLLRQNIMCQPDLTVELVDEDVGGVTGFGTEHVCKNWNQLNEWVAQWEGWHHVPKQQHDDEK